MLNITIPGYGELELRNLVLDYNGTLAADGRLLEGVAELIVAAAKLLEVHVLTADTYGSVERELSGLPVSIHVLEGGDELFGKKKVVEQLGTAGTLAFGNGRNDELMLEAAAVGILVLGHEGCASILFQCSDIVVRDVREAFALLLRENRMKATLRF